MDTTHIRRKLYDYIRDADARKIKAIYTLLENEIGEENDIWDDAFLKDMMRRKNEYQKKKVKGFSWEEVQKRAEKQLHSDRKL